jgi:hypothetical protein
MSAIEGPMTIVGYAWLDSEGDLVWAIREDMEHVKAQDRPAGCTPVVIEISPAEEWFTRKTEEQDYFGNISDQMNRFGDELRKLEFTLKATGRAD